MKILVIGGGGREHAIAWKFRQSSRVGDMYVAPGNAGTSGVAQNVEIGADDLDSLLQFAIAQKIDLTVVGPEIPLINGVVDRFEAAGLKVFGPSRAAARIEGSKAWAKGLMERHGIPTARAERFVDAERAIEYTTSLPTGSYVLKADGPAAGKGVILPETQNEAELAIREMIDGGIFGTAGATVLVEERMVGPEISVFAFVHGETVSAEIAACDYKRAFDGDAGPNTGGVGAYSPPELWTRDLAEEVRTKILVPTARAMVAEGCPFSGMLYTGLMLTEAGPRVIEFNCRFGDPESQVIIPKFDGDLVGVLAGMAAGTLDTSLVRWTSDSTVAVVVTSDGYPGSYATGKTISGLKEAEHIALVFHAGTKQAGGSVQTSGGRVLACVGQAGGMRQARELAYAAAAEIEFDGIRYRKDVAARAVVFS